MTLAEALRIYDINLTVDQFIIYSLIALMGYGLLVGAWTYTVSTLEHFKTKRMFIGITQNRCTANCFYKATINWI